MPGQFDFIEIKIQYDQLKDIATDLSLPYCYIDDHLYEIFLVASYHKIIYRSSILKDNNSDQIDFETNIKPGASQYYSFDEGIADKFKTYSPFTSTGIPIINNPQIDVNLSTRLSEADFDNHIGEVQIDPTQYTVLDRLKKIKDSIDTISVTVNPLSEIRVTPSNIIFDATFPSTTLDPLKWVTTTTGSGSATISLGEANLRTGSTSNSTTQLQSKRFQRYIAGTQHIFNATLRLSDTGIADNQRLFGTYDVNNGYYFILDGTQLKIGIRKNAIDSLITVFNNNPVVDLQYHRYSILYTDNYVIFKQDDNIIYTLNISNTLLVTNNHFKITFENKNINGATNDTSMYLESCSLIRYGVRDLSPLYFYFNQKSQTYLLKNSPGTLHRINIGGGSKTHFYIYNNITATGEIFYIANSSTAIGTTHFDLDFDVGMTIKTATDQTTEVTVTFD